ncbi:MAG: hypothetical protein HFI71_15360 [Lachnospiraceae bacterium]|jgi:hypothetical protein|nr:hypothetical protein [Lachnospiraceae bacterium]
MNTQEFKTFWDECLIPTFNDLKKTDSTLYIRDGSMDSLCREYNEIKNFVKRAFMKQSEREIKLDRHKIAACLAKAIVLDRPICKTIESDYTGKETEFTIANEVMAFSAAISIMRAYIEHKFNKKDPCIEKFKYAYGEICKHGFIFPETIMNVDYKSSVCWAWHHNAIDGYFDILGNANLFFMIENYAIVAYENKNPS